MKIAKFREHAVGRANYVWGEDKNIRGKGYVSKAFISILFLQQYDTIPSLPHARTLLEEKASLLMQY